MTPMGADEIDRLDGDRFHEVLAPVYETVGRLRRELPAETTLLGFCGAPWTVATYMIAGHGTPDQAPARLFSYQHPAAFSRLLTLTCRLFGGVSHPADRGRRRCGADFRFLGGRARRGVVRGASASSRSRRSSAGAGGLSGCADHRLSARCRRRYADYRAGNGVTALGLDWTVPLSQAARLQEAGAVQGNLDPLRLVAGGGRWTRVSMRSCERLATARWSSISAMASHLTRRSSMSRQ